MYNYSCNSDSDCDRFIPYPYPPYYVAQNITPRKAQWEIALEKLAQATEDFVKDCKNNFRSPRVEPIPPPVEKESWEINQEKLAQKVSSNVQEINFIEKENRKSFENIEIALEQIPKHLSEELQALSTIFDSPKKEEEVVVMDVTNDQILLEEQKSEKEIVHDRFEEEDRKIKIEGLKIVEKIEPPLHEEFVAIKNLIKSSSYLGDSEFFYYIQPKYFYEKYLEQSESLLGNRKHEKVIFLTNGVNNFIMDDGRKENFAESPWDVGITHYCCITWDLTHRIWDPGGFSVVMQ